MDSQETIVMVRAGNPENEIRFNWFRTLFEELGLAVHEIVWDRGKEQLQSTNPHKYIFDLPTPHGRGMRNLVNHARFMSFALRIVRKIRPRLIYVVDADTLAIAKFHPKANFIYDQYDPIETRPLPAFFAQFLGKVEYLASQKAVLRICANVNRINPSVRYLWTELPNFFPINMKKPSSFVSNSPFVVYFGSLEPNRRILEIIQYISELNICEVVVGGRGSQSEQIEKLSKHKKNVHFLGYVKHDMVLQISSTALAILAPYSPEHLQNIFTASNKLNESLQLGIPIITNTGTNLSSLVSDEKIGFLFDLDSPEELRIILHKIMAWSERDQRQFNERCRTVFEQQFLPASSRVRELVEERIRNEF